LLDSNKTPSTKEAAHFTYDGHECKNGLSSPQRMKKWRILQNSFISILQLSKIYHRGLKVEVSKNDAA
jgi:hypothetical protein